MNKQMFNDELLTIIPCLIHYELKPSFNILQ